MITYMKKLLCPAPPPEINIDKSYPGIELSYHHFVWQKRYKEASQEEFKLINALIILTENILKNNRVWRYSFGLKFGDFSSEPKFLNNKGVTALYNVILNDHFEYFNMLGAFYLLERKRLERQDKEKKQKEYRTIESAREVMNRVLKENEDQFK